MPPQNGVTRRNSHPIAEQNVGSEYEIDEQRQRSHNNTPNLIWKARSRLGAEQFRAATRNHSMVAISNSIALLQLNFRVAKLSPTAVEAGAGCVKLPAQGHSYTPRWSAC